MKTLKFIMTHKVSILSMFLMIAAAALGADGSFAMAEAPGADVTPAPDPNPSDNMDLVDPVNNPAGRPADETLQVDENGGKTQLQQKSATATDVRDAGLEAEDYDRAITEFRRFRFPIESYIANRCTPHKVNSPKHTHYRSAATDLDAVFNGVGENADNKTVAAGTNKVSIPVSAFINPEVMIPYSEVFVDLAEGYTKDEEGNEVSDGTLSLYVESYPEDEDGNIVFRVLNPGQTHAITIPAGSTFMVAATLCSESQMHVAPETWLPEKNEVTLKKKIATAVITDEFESQSKKVPFGKKDVLNSTIYNFKRKCARSHWLGKQTRVDVKVKELNGNREDSYGENGILRQIPMLYTHGEQMVDDDMMAISSLQFTDYAVNDKATAFCGKREMRRLMKLVNSAEHWKDVRTVTVNEYGIKVRKWVDNFGEIEFVYDPTLDDIGYQDFMVIVDLENAVRYYRVDDKKTTRDMSKTGEAREAKEYNICRIDCVALRGYNAILVCPEKVANKANKLGGILASAVSVTTLTGVSDKSKIYFLTADDSTAGFNAGTLVKWDVDLADWIEYEGKLKATA